MNSRDSDRIPLFRVSLPPRDVLLPELEKILYSGHVAEGEATWEFEKEFARYIGAKHTLATSSGTAALHMALNLAGVRSGDEVVSTPMTAEPTNLSILHAGARVVWADVEPRNGTLDPDDVRRRISDRTKAILVVHYAGVPADLEGLRKVASEFNVPLVEDAAHAFGARFRGRYIGSDSEFCVFSFQAIKHLTTVDGGMLSCSDAEIVSAGRRFRWFGMDRQALRTEVDISELGYKYHLNNVMGAIGLVQLRGISVIVQRHIDNGRYYDSFLRGIPGLELCSWHCAAEPSYWMYTILAERRDDLRRKLVEYGIESSLVHRRNDLHSLFSSARCELPGVDAFYSRMLHIPCGWWVSSEDRERIVDVIRQGW